MLGKQDLWWGWNKLRSCLPKHAHTPSSLHQSSSLWVNYKQETRDMKLNSTQNWPLLRAHSLQIFMQYNAREPCNTREHFAVSLESCVQLPGCKTSLLIPQYTMKLLIVHVAMWASFSTLSTFRGASTFNVTSFRKLAVFLLKIYSLTPLKYVTSTRMMKAEKDSPKLCVLAPYLHG
jgi:hypothetical protein